VAALWASGAHPERRVALEFDDGAYDAQDLSAALKLDGIDTMSRSISTKLAWTTPSSRSPRS
jgi:hypothetical protein